MSSEHARPQTTEPEPGPTDVVEPGSARAVQRAAQRGEAVAETDALTEGSPPVASRVEGQPPPASETPAAGAAPAQPAKPAAKRAPAKTAAAAAGSSTRAPRKRSTTAAAATAKAPTATKTRAPRASTRKTPAPAPAVDTRPVVLHIEGLTKRYGDTVAVDGVGLDVREGSFYGIVGPNGAGKTTTLSVATGLLRPDAGRVVVHGVDVWAEPVRAKHVIGVLPDKLRLFDRLTGAQFLHYAGTLRGLNAKTVRARTSDLAAAFGIEDALDRLVADYSAGMTKKIALAAAMIHSPRLLVLDEPFESVDPVSAANVIDILQRYTRAGGTVVLSSHGMDMIERICDSVAVIVRGQVLASGTIDEVRGAQTLEERFVELAGGRKAAEGMEWLHSFSD